MVYVGHHTGCPLDTDVTLLTLRSSDFARAFFGAVFIHRFPLPSTFTFTVVDSRLLRWLPRLVITVTVTDYTVDRATHFVTFPVTLFPLDYTSCCPFSCLTPRLRLIARILHLRSRLHLLPRIYG